MSSYRKTMGEVYNGMYLVEGNIDKIKDIVSKKSASKIDGVMVDMFTASAISQIYDKVNDANKKKMEKLPITKLAALAMKMMKNEYVPEEVDEKYDSDKFFGGKGTPEQRLQLLKLGNKALRALGGSPKQKEIQKEINALRKKMGMKVSEEVDLDEKKKEVVFKGTPAQIKKQMQNLKKKDKLKIGEEDDLDEDYVITVKDKEVNRYKSEKDARKAFSDLVQMHGRDVKVFKEEVELDEGSWHIAKNMNALKKKMQKPIPKGDLMVKFVMKHIGDDELMDAMFDAKQGTDMVPMIKSAMKRLNIKEEVEIDESGHTDVASAMTNVKVATSALTKMSGELSKLSPEDALPSWWTNKVAVAVDKLDGMADYLDTQVEEIELDEKVKVGDKVKVKLRRPGGTTVQDGKVIKIEKDSIRDGAGNKRDSIIVMHDFSRRPSRVAMTDIVKEEVELDELMPATKHVAKSKKNPDMFCVFDKDGNEVKLFKDKKDAEEYAIKNHDALNEEDDLDEAMGSMRPETGLKGNIITKLAIAMSQGGMSTSEVYKQMTILGKKKLPELKKLAKELQMKQLKQKKEETDLDEGTYRIGNMKKSGNFKGKDAEDAIKQAIKKGIKVDREFTVYDRDKREFIYKNDKPAVATKGTYNEEADLDEASARGDAKRSMSRDRDFGRKDDLDKDDAASDDDVKAASKNIMMQLRKAANLRGTFAVEFGDKKKVKVDPKVAQAAASKYNSLRRPADKEKFQMQIAKSYKDMLKVVQEAVSPAQQAAIAISKKERGEKPKKESKFGTINKQLKGEK